MLATSPFGPLSRHATLDEEAEQLLLVNRGEPHQDVRIPRVMGGDEVGFGRRLDQRLLAADIDFDNQDVALLAHPERGRAEPRACLDAGRREGQLPHRLERHYRGPLRRPYDRRLPLIVQSAWRISPRW